RADRRCLRHDHPQPGHQPQRHLQLGPEFAQRLMIVPPDGPAAKPDHAGSALLLSRGAGPARWGEADWLGARGPSRSPLEPWGRPPAWSRPGSGTAARARRGIDPDHGGWGSPPRPARPTPGMRGGPAGLYAEAADSRAKSSRRPRE